MCELLGMSANVATDICYSFSGLKERGGQTGPHKDGWGISLYEGKASRTFHDPLPSVSSEIADWIEHHAIKSKIIISHIRLANRGKVSLENTHPFTRELWGCSWVFAHNGQLNNIKKKKLHFYHPVGTTDSEYAFCYMMDRIRRRFPKRPAKQKDLWNYIRRLSRELNILGVFSFLLSDSRHLFAYCSNKMVWVTREFPFIETKLIDTGEVLDLREKFSIKDKVCVIASQPLTENEDWHLMEKGDFVVFKNGQAIPHHA
ncbi:MAG: class II glutamine amidotransferase [Gammaproteobacteria bacterium]